MDPSINPLKTLLQLHLASDASVASRLPDILAALNKDCFLPSPYLTGWATKINSLLHSKEPCGRWAGLCLALRTSEHAPELMMEYAQGWLSVALPLLSKNESVPVLKAAIRLIFKIFSGAMNTPEFQRQVSTPNVPKLATAMVALAEKHNDTGFKTFILSVLSKLVYLYPNLLRTSQPSLSSLALSFLNGNATGSANQNLIDAASQLYASLSFTGGKVGTSNLWRKSIEENISYGWNSFFALRTTFPMEAQRARLAKVGSGDPLVVVPLNLDRLRCCTSVLRDLFRVPVSRQVQLPLGSLVKFCLALLTCSSESQIEGHMDANVRAMEVMIVPEMWKYGSQILTYLAPCARHHLLPHLPRLMKCLIIHLERKPEADLRLSFLESLEALMTHCHPLDSDVILNRLSKGILPFLSVTLTEANNASVESGQNAFVRKGKRRNRTFEGDEILRSSKKLICPTVEDEESLIVTLRVLRYLLRNPYLSPHMYSMSARVSLAMHLNLPRLPRAFLSADPLYHARLSQAIQGIIRDVATGTSNVTSKSAGLVVACSGNDQETQRYLELLLHPRVPPLIRRDPYIQSLALFHSEESQEEAIIRSDLGLTVDNNAPHHLSDFSNQHIRPTPSDHDFQGQNQTANLRNVASVSQQPGGAAQTLPLTTRSSAAAADVSANIERQVKQVEQAMEVTPEPAQQPGSATKSVSVAFGEPGIQPPQVQVQPILTSQLAMMDEGEDEEMPAIDMASDTDDSDT